MKEFIGLRIDGHDLNKAFKKFEPDFNYISFGRYESLVINCIEKSVGDKYNWISYWVYDLEEGKKAKSGTVSDKNGKDIPIKTLSDLYNIIKNPECN